jgi:hypothetical protein
VGVCQVQVGCDHHTQAEVVAEDHIERTVHSNEGQRSEQPLPKQKRPANSPAFFVLVREQIRRLTWRR